MATQKTKKTKRPDKRPARDRYWSSGRLANRKARNLVKYNGFADVVTAKAHWRSVRTHRIRRNG